MRFLCLGLLVFLILGCAEKESIDGLYDRSRAEMRSPNFEQALTLAEEGVVRSEKEQSKIWEWRFRYLKAEIHIRKREPEVATEILSSVLPTEAQTPSIQGRRKVLQGWLAMRNGETEKCEALWQEAAELGQKAQDQTLLLEVEWFQSFLFWGLGRSEETFAVLRSAAARAKSLEDWFLLAQICNNFGFNLHKRFYRYDEAIPWFEKALEANTFLNNLSLGSGVLANIGLCYSRLGHFEKASEYFQKAVAGHQATKNFEGLLGTLGDMGNNEYFQGNFKKAGQYYERGFNLAMEKNEPQDAARWANNMALIFIERNDWQAAESWNQRALQLKQSQNMKDSIPYATLNSALIAQGRDQHQQALELFDRALSESLELKGSEIIWEAKSGKAKSLLAMDRWQQAKEQFQAAILDVEESSSVVTLAENQISYFSSLMGTYREYVDALVAHGEEDLALKVCESSRARSLAEKFNLPFVSEKFKPRADLRNEIYFSYWLAPKRSFLWVVHPGGTQHFILPPGGEIEQHVEGYRDFILSRADPLQEACKDGRWLFDQLVAPALPLMNGIQSVTLIPDGALYRLNFETLPVTSGRPRFWIEDAVFTISPSLNLALTGPGVTELQDKSFFLVGNPVEVEPAFPVLLNSKREMERIAVHLDGFPGSAYSEGEATPSRFLNSDMDRYDIIHFAAHAEANLQMPLASAVILSPDPQTGQHKLYARDILKSPLNASLVTLSACRSAGAKTYSGEGLVGFAWAFLNAGARNVVAGLWDVEDRSTFRIMDQFYASLIGENTVEDALRISKLKFIEAQGHYHKPYYWGAFQVYIR